MLKNSELNRGRAPGIVEQRCAFGDHAHPFANVENGEKDSENGGDHGPAESFGFVALLGRAHSDEHGQAAGEQDERHQGDVGDAVKRPRPSREWRCG